MTIQELIDKLMEIPEHRRKICNVCIRYDREYNNNIVDVVLSKNHNYYLLVID